MRTYATEEDLTDAKVDVPENAAGLLRSASSLVRSSTKTARYRTDGHGMPVEPYIVDAFRDATCAQVKFWADMGVDPTLGAAGVKPLAASKSINGASVQYSTYVSTAEARANAAGTLGPDAYYILEDAGLLGGAVQLL
ncbi:hypothetical protein NNX28_16990 [Arthrobacter sp. zg-Y859]|uniref:Uncharacterized protein n=1 Tax=Arthrobacter jinronghuae TaxID=2964609 RepID=A0ABT1NVI4_9MICC|nr:hypothetical protein [Arthrobacter jinronghuae]MCQ1951616.1 hypothetical protein [Arthrobacter jinronghuae]UWX79670.1 hypothetical protein N2K98_05590 [Arthrobacter jinronghuae]